MLETQDFQSEVEASRLMSCRQNLEVYSCHLMQQKVQAWKARAPCRILLENRTLLLQLSPDTHS